MTSAPVASSRTFTFGSRTVSFETGRIARQAHGSVLVRSGDTTLLVTAVAAESPRAAADFFPLTVEYREKSAAVGKVPGSYQRREGRIADHEVLESRLIDRSIRPLFPEGYRNEVQVQATVLSADPDADCGVLAILGAGAALHLSPIPFGGPAGGLRIVRTDGRWSLLPGRAERERAELDFVVSVGPGGLVMVEGGAKEQSEEVCAEALFEVEEALGAFLRGMDEWRAEVGVAKDPFAAPAFDADVKSAIDAAFSARLAEALIVPGKRERRATIRVLRDEATLAYAERPEVRAEEIFAELEYRVLRRMIAQQKKRLDGRTPVQIRPIWGETGWLQRTHGSALFTRGETQAMVSCTLGPSDDEQRIDRLFGEQRVRFMLHYNFPPYSVGEIRALRGPGRREIGHGELARRAIVPSLPETEAFPYVIRIDSEISESNGSSSMATTCGATLALMDAGVPVSRPVAGIAMGLIKEGSETVILSDILGDEDHLGDMDFKVAGTERGITAVQMDNKIGGLDRSVLTAALAQAREGRAHILREMAKILAAPRKELARHAPRMLAMRVRTNMIGAVIGPKGATIKSIQEDTGARISIADDGLVTIFASEGDAAKKALARVKGVAGEVEIGKYYKGVVTGVKEFGAFVKIFEQAEGLVHISELAHERVARVEDITREGAEMIVKVLGVDDRGRIKLSRRAALDVDPAVVEG